MEEGHYRVHRPPVWPGRFSRLAAVRQQTALACISKSGLIFRSKTPFLRSDPSGPGTWDRYVRPTHGFGRCRTANRACPPRFCTRVPRRRLSHPPQCFGCSCSQDTKRHGSPGGRVLCLRTHRLRSHIPYSDI